jgi:hypothetical protein
MIATGKGRAVLKGRGLSDVHPSKPVGVTEDVSHSLTCLGGQGWCHRLTALAQYAPGVIHVMMVTGKGRAVLKGRGFSGVPPSKLASSSSSSADGSD